MKPFFTTVGLALGLLAVPLSAANLLQNSSFELGTSYYGRAEGGNNDGPLQGMALTNSPARTGGFSMKQINRTVGGNCWASFPIRLKQSTAYCFSFYGQADSAGPNIKVTINNARGTGAAGRTPNWGGVDGPTVDFNVAVGTTWVRYWTNWVTPAGSNTAYTIRFEPKLFGGQIVYMDDMQLEEVASIFTQPTAYAPCADVETSIVFPDNRGANIFWTNEVCSVPVLTYNWSGASVSATNVWAQHNYKFDVINSNSFVQTVGAGLVVTNTLDLTPTTNILGTYRVSTWVKGYDAPTIAENTFGVIRRPVPIPYPSTNSHFGSMIAFERFWLTNCYNIGFKWIRTLSVGRTNSLIAGQFLRYSYVTTGMPFSGNGYNQLTNADGTTAWLTNAGNQAGMALATNSGFTILGVIEWLRDGGAVVQNMTWAVEPFTGGGGTTYPTHTVYTNWLLYPSNYYRYAVAVVAAYSPYIKYWELGNEFDTEGGFDFVGPPGGGGDNAMKWISLIISNGWTAIKSNFPSMILIPLNAFQPTTFDKVFTILGTNDFIDDRIVSSHVYGGGEFGAERLYTNVGKPFGVVEHWQTESGTTCRSERQNLPQEEIAFGNVGVAGSRGNEGSDPVQRSAEMWRNYVMWSKWPPNLKWMWHLVDEKRSVIDPQSHTLFDWDGSITMRGVVVSAMAQLLEGSVGRSNLNNNAVPEGFLGSVSAGVNGGKFARGVTNCPLVIFWGTNDFLCYRAHIKLATNLFNLYDMFGNSLPRQTNIVFSNQPWIVEGQAGVLSNVIWDGVFIEATNSDTILPKVIFTKHPTKPLMEDDTFSWRWAARDNLIAQFPQGGGAAFGGLGGQASAVTNLLQHRHLLAGYDGAFSSWRSDPTNSPTPWAFTANYTNVPAGNYIMHVQVADRTGNIGSNQFAMTVLGEVIPPPPPIGPSGAKVRIGITP